MRAVPYLEGSAKKYALAAVDAEKRGDYESAIINLNKAIEYLTEIVRNYPDYPLAHIYRRLIAQYRKKAKDLERKARMIPASGDEVYVDTRGEDGGGDGDEAPEFVLKEKPSITSRI